MKDLTKSTKADLLAEIERLRAQSDQSEAAEYRVGQENRRLQDRVRELERERDTHSRLYICYDRWVSAGPTFPPQFTEAPVDTPPSVVCDWVVCFTPNQVERDAITAMWNERINFFLQNNMTDCALSLMQAQSHINLNAFRLTESRTFMGGPQAGRDFNGFYHFPSGTMFIWEGLTASPGEFNSTAVHEGVHARLGSLLNLLLLRPQINAFDRSQTAAIQ